MATVELRRPQKLNSLSLPMIHELRAIYGKLVGSGVRCLVLSGEGRALCAGGDVAEVRQGVLDGDRLPADFFYDEYELDYLIATLYERHQIVQIALWDGIVMGGGVGLSIHSPIKIATENTLFAMPETAIGLFPDVGMTWKLSRLPAGEAVGLYLGLSGHRLRAADCLRAGLATHFCPAAQLGEVLPRLRELSGHGGSIDLEAVGALIDDVAGGAKPDQGKAVLQINHEIIQRCFGEGVASVEEVILRLEADGGAFAMQARDALLRMSPTSLKVSFEAVRRHRDVDLQQAFVTEYRMSQAFMRPQPESDFTEGIRAVLVDKDNSPAWQPATLGAVDAARVQRFFEPLSAEHPRGELRV